MGTGVYQTLVSILVGWSFAAFVLGVLYVVMYYMGRWVYFINGYFWLIVSAFVLLLGIKTHKEFVLSCLKRLGIITIIGSIAAIIHWFTH